VAELAEVISLIVSFTTHVRGDFILSSWKEVWSPLLLRNDDSRGHVT